MVYCQNCGTENEKNSTFCFNCGNKLIKENNLCPNCGVVNPSESKFCIKCGKNLKNDTNHEVIKKKREVEKFNPKGTINDFKNDMDILSKFAQETTKMINKTSIRLPNDENLDINFNSKLQDIKNKIEIQKKELDRKLKVLSTDIIFIKFSKDVNDPQLIKFNISIDEAELNKYVEFYKN